MWRWGARFFWRALLTSALVVSPVVTNPAPIHSELGDAGDSPGTAQLVGGDGPVATPVTNITGLIRSSGDGDVFRVFIGNPAGFSVSTVGQPGTLYDTVLHLFDDSGNAIIGNDDVSNLDFRSTIPVGSLIGFPTGYDLLGTSAYDNDPSDFGGFELFTDNFPGLQTPTGVGPLVGYDGDGFSIGSYDIVLTGIFHTTTPEPASRRVFGSCAVALLPSRRWRMRHAG
jgi:hypothetical protein